MDGEHPLVGQLAEFNPQQRFGVVWKIIFFSTASVVFGSAVITVFLLTFTEIAPFAWLNAIYLCIFAFCMMVVDFPFEFAVIHEARALVYKYLMFLTRFTGRGLFYIFLGSLVVASLSEVSYILSLPLGAAVGAVGVFVTLVAVFKSKKLEKLRTKLQATGKGAMLCPPNGIPASQLVQAAREQGITFSDNDLEYVCRALQGSYKQDTLISQEDFNLWINSPHRYWL